MSAMAMSKSIRADLSLRAAPRQGRSILTCERLLDVAGELLGEVGVDRISTNQIACKAGVTPPALYRYFKDKYAVLEALGERLMARQNAVLFAWLDTYAPQGIEALAGSVEELMQKTAEVTAAEPGAIWTLRALRAVPQLAHVRLSSHRLVTERICQVYAAFLPELPYAVLWRRIRISIEFGFATGEMLYEETEIPPEALLHDAAIMLRQALMP